MPLTLTDIGHRNSKVGKSVCHTTRSGEMHHMGTCPSSCPLLGEHNKQHPTNEFDLEYAKALVKAVPKEGRAWGYTHWAHYFWDHLGFNTKTTTTMNFSAHNWRHAQWIAKHCDGVPVVVILSEIPDQKFGDVPAMFCPADTMQDMDCGRCGGSKGPLCARPDRKFIVVFKVKRWKKTPCYAANGFVIKQWVRSMKNFVLGSSDGKELLKWVSKFPYHSLLRHHIAGDMGKVR